MTRRPARHSAPHPRGLSNAVPKAEPIGEPVHGDRADDEQAESEDEQDSPRRASPRQRSLAPPPTRGFSRLLNIALRARSQRDAPREHPQRERRDTDRKPGAAPTSFSATTAW